MRKYLADPKFKDDAFSALAERFASRERFDIFFEGLRDDDARNEFLRVANYYLYLVKAGDWHVDHPSSNPVIDYFTNSFKLVALFGAIESLSDKRYQDFYDWLREEAPISSFPIDRAALGPLHAEYKKSYGAVRRCVRFFERLSSERQEELCAAIKIDRKPLPNIKRVANYLYEQRSRFVHGAELLSELSGALTYSESRGKGVWIQLSMAGLERAFEEGLVLHFTGGE